jgi:hypothetical protein
MIEQGSLEWHRQRFRKITSSEVSVLMSDKKELTQGARTYLMSKVAECLKSDEILLQEAEANEAMNVWSLKHGKECEPIARYWLSKKIVSEIIETEFFPHAKLRYGGSDDGWIREVDGIAEIKCPLNSGKHLYNCEAAQSVDLFKKNLKDYYWQMQSNMILQDKKVGYFCTFDPRIDNKWGLTFLRVPRNDEDCELLLRKVEEGHNFIEEKLSFFK